MAEDRLLLTFTGRDAPGISARIAAIVDREGARLHDVEQVVVQGYLTLAFSLSFGDPAREESAIKELLFAAKNLNLGLEYRRWQPSADQGARQRFALTAIARSLGTQHVLQGAQTLAEHGANIERIHRLSEAGLTAV